MVVEATMRVLAQNGYEPRLVMKSSRVLEESIIKRMCAFWGGIYNVRACDEMRRLIEKDRPDVVHAHNVYPIRQACLSCILRFSPAEVRVLR